MENNTVHDAWLDLFNVRRDDLVKLLEDMHKSSSGSGSSSHNSGNKLDVNLHDWKRAADMIKDGLKLIEAEVLLAREKKNK